MYEHIRELTGWTYPQIAALTIPQMRNILNRGRKKAPGILGRRAMKEVLARLKRGEL